MRRNPKKYACGRYSDSDNCTAYRSVADPDPGFDPSIRDPGWVKSQDPDPG
jgi:hypothetical protein